jgi:beta-lactamase regulating signal transducer with metallopeptidase domain
MMALALELAIKGSVVMAASGLTVLLLRRRASASWRHVVCSLAAGALLILPLMSAALPAWEVPIEVSPSAPIVTQSAGVPEVTARPTGIAGSPLLPSEALSTTATETAAGPIPWAQWLSVLYVSGVVMLVTHLAVARWSMRSLARNATTVTDPDWVALLRACEDDMHVARPVRLLRSLEQTMPMAFGIRRPGILIPSIADTWSVDRRRAVLLHELAHIARHDCLTQFLASVAAVVYWPHPGVWWMARRLQVERELACDDRVLSIGTGARDYAEHLLELAYALGGSRAPALAVSMARPQQLEGRMLAVLDAARNRATPARRGAFMSLAGALAIVMPLAAAETVLVEPPAPIPAAAAPAPATALVEQRTPARATDSRRSQERPSREPGTWELRPSRQEGRVNLRITERRDSSRSFTIEMSRLEGLTNAMLSGARGDLSFSLKRDAGTFVFEGVFRAGVGAGTYTFVPSDTYPAELVKRGYARPTSEQQYRMALGDVGITFLDELNRQRYAKADLDTLVRAADHGVQYEYLRGMGDAGYRLGQLEPLIRMRDHGVDPEYIRDLEDLGLSGLTADDLVRARDHGVDPDYVRDLRDLGHRLALDELVRARDHGVNPEYIRALRSHGYDRLSIEQLITARDHGVDDGYVAEMRRLGYRLTMDELRNARDHGVDPGFAQGMIKQGYKNLSIGDLVRLRDHGVDPEWVRRQNARLREPMTVDELIRLRDRGGDH